MKDHDYEMTYQKLASTLNHEGLAWLVRQVTEQILMGKISVSSSRDGKKRVRKGKKTSTGTYSTEYTARERLALLVAATKHAIVDRVDMEAKVLSFFNETSESNIEAIEFYSEVEDELEVVINQQRTVERQAHAYKIEEMLNFLLEGVKDGH